MGKGKNGTVLALGVLLVFAGCGPGPVVEPSPLLTIDRGLTPVMTPERVAEIVLQQIQASERTVGGVAAPPRILRMTVTTTPNVGRIEPDAGAGGPLPLRIDGRDIVWVVRAQGTFSTRRGRLGAEPPAATSGYYVIADADGSILAFGFP